MLRTAVRPASLVARTTLRLRQPGSLRGLHATLPAASGGHAAPSIFGPGGKPGQVPSDLEQATGLERLQLLGELEGIDVFDDSPLDSSRVGTKADPILVPSYDSKRIVGCTGSPADSHDTMWFWVRDNKHSRCPECGSVYAIKSLDGTVVEPTPA